MTQRQGLFRSRTDKVLGGVCGGIAKSLNTDPFIIRLIFAILFIFAGSGILLYIILWIALPEEPFTLYQESGMAGDPSPGENPEEPAGANESPVYPKSSTDGALIGGIILICIGLVFLASRFIPRFHLGDYWPVILIIAGLVVIASSFSLKKRT